MPKWKRIDTGTDVGYESENGHAKIFDNGGGMGPSKGSGRWAVEIDGKWVANKDTLPDAKAFAETKMEEKHYRITHG